MQQLTRLSEPQKKQFALMLRLVDKDKLSTATDEDLVKIVEKAENDFFQVLEGIPGHKSEKDEPDPDTVSETTKAYIAYRKDIEKESRDDSKALGGKKLIGKKLEG